MLTVGIGMRTRTGAHRMHVILALGLGPEGARSEFELSARVPGGL